MKRYSEKLMYTSDHPCRANAFKGAVMALLTDSKHCFAYVLPTELNEFCIGVPKLYETAEGWAKAYTKFHGGHYMTAEEAYKVIEYAYQHTAPTADEFKPQPRRKSRSAATKAAAEVPVKELEANKTMHSSASIKADENQPSRKGQAKPVGTRAQNKSFNDFMELLDAKNEELNKAYALIDAQRKTNIAQEKVLKNLSK